MDKKVTGERPSAVDPQVAANKEAVLARKTRSLTLLDWALLKPAIWASFVKLKPSVQWRNPVMFVVYIGSIVTTLLFAAGPARPERWIRAGRGGVAVVHRAVRQFRRGAGRRPQQGPGGGHARAAPDPVGQEAGRAAPRRQVAARALREPAPRRLRAGGHPRHDSAGRRGDRRRGLGRRVGDHRGIRAGGARVGRRLLVRDRRHAGAVRLAGGAHRRQSRRVVPGPHDQHGRRRPSARRHRTRSRSPSC